MHDRPCAGGGSASPQIAVNSANSRPAAMGRLLPLEGLRPLLCLSVIVYHLSRTSYRPPGTKNPPLSFGAAAVSIFFIMSGFVNHMGRKGRAPASIAEGRAFFLKVMARIAPAYMVAQCWAAWHNREWIFRASAWDVASVIFLDVTMLGSWFGTSYAWKFNGSLWFVQSLLWGGTFAYCCLGRAVTVHLQKRPCACLPACGHHCMRNQIIIHRPHRSRYHAGPLLDWHQN